ERRPCLAYNLGRHEKTLPPPDDSCGGVRRTIARLDRQPRWRIRHHAQHHLPDGEQLCRQTRCLQAAERELPDPDADLHPRGMLGDTDLQRECPGKEPLKVAAIVNWYGITDVVDLLDGPNQKSYAVAWLSSMPNRNELGKRLSPLEYVRKGQPPVITIHGDAD